MPLFLGASDCGPDEMMVIPLLKLDFYKAKTNKQTNTGEKGTCLSQKTVWCGRATPPLHVGEMGPPRKDNK